MNSFIWNAANLNIGTTLIHSYTSNYLPVVLHYLLV
jgi:hypothetical protein